MMQVILKDLRFYSHHGFHKEEALTGGAFVLNVVVWYEPNELPVVSISNTIDYSEIYAMVSERMQSRTLLLETIATELAARIFDKFPIATEVKIAIDKLHPPIPNFQGSAGVVYQVKRNRT
jgi:7,8-dihydroneopterin aldolase/epimerase/oxygenase